MSPSRPADRVLDIWVPGKCEPQGSATAFVPEKNGRPIRRPGGSIVVNVTSDNPALKKWRRTVSLAAEAARARDAGRPHAPDPIDKPAAFTVNATFYLLRPEITHYRTGRHAHLVRDFAPAYPVTIPDVDKLLRAGFDALTGIVYVDDSQVVDAILSKRYAVPTALGDGTGMRITVDQHPIQHAMDLPPELRRRPADEPQAPQRALFDGAAL